MINKYLFLVDIMHYGCNGCFSTLTNRRYVKSGNDSVEPIGKFELHKSPDISCFIYALIALIRNDIPIAFKYIEIGEIVPFWIVFCWSDCKPTSKDMEWAQGEIVRQGIGN